MNADPEQIEVSKSPKNIEKSFTSLRFCNHASEFEKNSKTTKKFEKKNRKKMQFNIKETLFRMLFFHPWCLQYRKYIFDLKFTIKVSVIMKWGHGCKIWDWSIILHYFAEYLTCMLTLGLRSYRSSNLVIDLKMWEKFESNPPVCKSWQLRADSWHDNSMTFKKANVWKASSSTRILHLPQKNQRLRGTRVALAPKKTTNYE